MFGNAAFCIESFGVSIDDCLIYQWSKEELGGVRKLKFKSIVLMLNLCKYDLSFLCY